MALDMITINLSEWPEQCPICGEWEPGHLNHAVAFCCEPTHDEIGDESSVYPGHTVGGMSCCKTCHDNHYWMLHMRHAAVARNTKTNRFHPIVFKPETAPGRAQRTAGGGKINHIAFRHHKEGFETEPEARTYIGHHSHILQDSGLLFDWSGEDEPTTSWFFPALG